MSEYNGCYVKLATDNTFWYVEDGERLMVENTDHMYQIGLKPIYTISPDDLQDIPFVGESDEEE
jgi:hypothetical protein